MSLLSHAAHFVKTPIIRLLPENLFFTNFYKITIVIYNIYVDDDFTFEFGKILIWRVK